MNKSIYKSLLKDLQAIADKYMAGDISLECYQLEIFKAEKEITSVEEGRLRSLLLNHENELELIRFTTSDADSLQVEVRKFRHEIDSWI